MRPAEATPPPGRRREPERYRPWPARGRHVSGHNRTNGYSPNGYSTNGHSPNGHSPNGGSPHGDNGGPPRAGDPSQAPTATSGMVGRIPIEQGQMGRTAGRGVMWALGSQWASFASQVVALVVLARLISPFEFGLVGMALTFTVFADQFRGMGLSQAIITRDDLTLRQVNGLFWINAGAGVLLAGVMVGLAPVAVLFYGEDQLLGIMAVLALSYVFSGLSVQPSALLARQLSFRAIALRDTAARVLANTAAVVLGVMGAGYWALVAQQVLTQVLLAAFVWLAISWRPQRPGGFRESRSLLSFGLGVTIADFAVAASRNGDYVLVGRFLGASALGYYTRAYNLVMLPVRQLKTPLGNVVIPMLSTLLAEPARYVRLYRATVSGLSHVGMPLTAGLAVAASPVVLTIFGPRWEPAVDIFRFLAIAGVVQMVTGTLGWLLITTDRAGDYARYSVLTGIFTVLTFAAGLPWGAVGVAAAYAAGQVVMLVPSILYCVGPSPVRAQDVFSAMWRPVVSAVLVSGIMLSVGEVVEARPWVEFLLFAATGAVAWLTVMVVWRGARREVTELVSIMRRRRAPVPT